MIDEQVVSKQGKRIRRILGELETTLGRGLTAEDVVEVAAPAEHPLHEYFEWDDSVAGHAYRKHQARALMRRVKVRIVEEQAPGQKRVFQMSGYSNVLINDHREYKATRDVFSDPALREQVLRRALSEMQAWAARYKQFAEFAEVIAAVEAAQTVVTPPAATPRPGRQRAS